MKIRGIIVVFRERLRYVPFSFTLPSNEDTKNYELQVSCKDYSFMSVDKLVGATSIGLGPIQDQGIIC